MQNEYLITVLITNYNTLDFVRLSFYALKQLTKNKFKVIINDNGSDVKDLAGLEKIARENDNVILNFRKSENKKASFAHAQAVDTLVKMSDTKYTVILDSDCIFLLNNWDEYLISNLNEKTKIIGTPLPKGRSGLKPDDFPFQFAVMFETKVYKSLNISCMPGDISKGEDTCWEWKPKFINNGYSGKILHAKSTRDAKGGAFQNITGVVEYYTDNGELIASHFGRGSSGGSFKFLTNNYYFDILIKPIREYMARQAKRKWIKIAQRIIDEQSYIKRIKALDDRPALKIALGYEIKDGPWGGGNQFLRSFRDYLKNRGFQVVYQLEKDIDLIVMINPRKGSGTFNHKDVKRYRRKYPYVKVIHRINETDKAKNTTKTDRLRIQASKESDAVIFISEWVKNYYISKGFNKNILHTVILNGADKNIFNAKNHSLWEKGKPMKIVTHHWSDNPMKGADIYQQFDDLLEDPKMRENFEFTYIGCLPQGSKFKNTRYIEPLYGEKLAQELRNHHVYLTAARWESCGMHPIEGACCGLPVLYIDEGGGITESCKGFGIKFTKDNFQESLLKIQEQYYTLQEKVNLFPLYAETVNKKYEKFILSLLSKNG